MAPMHHCLVCVSTEMNWHFSITQCKLRPFSFAKLHIDIEVFALFQYVSSSVPDYSSVSFVFIADYYFCFIDSHLSAPALQCPLAISEASLCLCLLF